MSGLDELRDGIGFGQQLRCNSPILPLPGLRPAPIQQPRRPKDGDNVIGAGTEFVFMHAAVNRLDQATIPVSTPTLSAGKDADAVPTRPDRLELLHVQRQPTAAVASTKRDTFTREPGPSAIGWMVPRS